MARTSTTIDAVGAVVRHPDVGSNGRDGQFPGSGVAQPGSGLASPALFPVFVEITVKASDVLPLLSAAEQTALANRNPVLVFLAGLTNDDGTPYTYARNLPNPEAALAWAKATEQQYLALRAQIGTGDQHRLPGEQ